MKIIFNTLIICLISVLSIRGQSDSNYSDLNYYPLQTGNYFEYVGRLWELPYYDDSTYSSISILGDTLLENGIIYKSLLSKDIVKDSIRYKYFERIDSLDGSVYRYELNDQFLNHEYKIDSIFAQIGDTIKCSRANSGDQENYQTIVLNIETDTVLGKLTEIKTFWDFSFIPGYSYDLAKGFGFYQAYNCEFSCGSSRLVYAIIDGLEYGDKITSIEHQGNSSPKSLKIYQNYPNPFNPSTKIVIEIPFKSKIELSVYNIQGELIRVIANGEYSSGTYTFEFEGQDVVSGIYFAKLSRNNFSKSIKMLMLK